MHSTNSNIFMYIRIFYIHVLIVTRTIRNFVSQKSTFRGIVRVHLCSPSPFHGPICFSFEQETERGGGRRARLSYGNSATMPRGSGIAVGVDR